MTIEDRLQGLPQMVRLGFKPPFGFLIYPDKFQHFPAREWTSEQFLEKIAELFGTTENLITTTWDSMLVISQPDQSLALVLPQFQRGDQLGL